MLNPVTSLAVMLPNGRILTAQPDTNSKYITITGLKGGNLVLIHHEEISGVADLIHTLFPYTLEMSGEKK